MLRLLFLLLLSTTANTQSLEDLRTDYEAGKPEAIYPYVKALIAAGEPYLRTANDALRQPSLDFSAPATLRLIFIATTEADSRLYDLLLQHRPAIEELEGDTAFYQQAHRAIMTTVDKALEYRSEDLMQTAVDKMALLDKSESKRLESQGAFALALQNTDRKALVKATKNYLKRGAAGDEDRLRDLANTLQNSDFINYSEVIDLAAAAAAELSDEGWRDYYRLARFLQERKRLDQALQYAELSLTDLGEGPANYQQAIQALIDELREAIK